MTDAIQARRPDRREFEPTPTGPEQAPARARPDVDPQAIPYTPAVPQSASRAMGPRPPLDHLARQIDERRGQLANAKDPAERGRLAGEVAQLQRDWATEASLKWKAPGPSLDPNRATEGELVKAYTWLKYGGVVPRDELARGASYAQHLEAAVAVRAPWAGAAKLESFPPDVQRRAIQGALARHGVRCEPNDDLPKLRGKHAKAEQDARAASLAASVSKTEADGKQKAIGLDGRQGTSARLDDYEMAEYVKALNPGTTTGAIAAGVFGGGKVEDMRRAGELGNVVESFDGAMAGGPPAETEPRYGMAKRFELPGPAEKEPRR